ncbi:hypothetical protein MTP04_15100 [Lysinibacillus sp. PLM2]|nr:hypothetical protein MTP04_15100 [Lysinibacillus sp. PLM2]
MQTNTLFDPGIFVLNSAATGPLGHLPALDVMWISFWSIGLLIFSVLILSATRKWIKNGFLAAIFKLFAFVLFLFGSYLMALVVFTWPA